MNSQPAIEPDQSPIRAGIALIGRAGCYLVRQRPPGTIYAGYWEFPGGKCEPGEDPAQATIRECLEETGLIVVASRLRCTTTYHYPHGLVKLYFFDCALMDRFAQPASGSGFRWVPAGELARLKFPEANETVIAELAGQSGC
jgi:8-oxo-dGTP diphosphatase